MWPMLYFAKVCHIIRINVKSKDFGTALAMWESWHCCAHRPTCINKSIKPTTAASHSPKQVFFYCLSPLSLPRSVFPLRELICHRSKVGDPDWGTRWAMEGHRCQMHHKWIWHMFWPTYPLLYSLRPKICLNTDVSSYILVLDTSVSKQM